MTAIHLHRAITDPVTQRLREAAQRAKAKSAMKADACEKCPTCGQSMRGGNLWGLTDAERLVVELLGYGAMSVQIAEATGRSPKTISMLVTRACRRAGLPNRDALVTEWRRALLLGLAKPTPPESLPQIEPRERVARADGLRRAERVPSNRYTCARCGVGFKGAGSSRPNKYCGVACLHAARTEGRKPPEQLSEALPIGKFRQHRSGAVRRGIAFELTFEQWWAIWEASGKWEQRGVNLGQYVMARKGDVGPYAVDNVEIILHAQNIRDAHSNGRNPNAGRRRKVTAAPDTAQSASSVGRVGEKTSHPDESFAAMGEADRLEMEERGYGG